MKRVKACSDNMKKHIKVYSSASIKKNKSMLDVYEFAKQFEIDHKYLIDSLKDL